MATIGDQDYLRACAGLDVHGVTATIRELVRPGKGLRGQSSGQQRDVAADALRVPLQMDSER
jgi:hypothetical protein